MFLGSFYGQKQKMVVIHDTDNTSELFDYHIDRKFPFSSADKLGDGKIGSIRRCLIHRDDGVLCHGTRNSDDGYELEHLRAGCYSDTDTDRRSRCHHDPFGIYADDSQKNGHCRQIANTGFF